ncbi:hypothetical protein ACQ4M3_02605 [Leptolyngbya sp. AN03gr2]|uniref:hypothetical protein n=1 Tax=unclassified Leptolyngbya TaxID=2650499 RepID=UPI003D311FAE
MFEKYRKMLHFDAISPVIGNHGLSEQSPLKGTESQLQQTLQSVSTDFVPIAPNSIRGAIDAMNDYFSNTLLGRAAEEVLREGSTES